MKENVLAYKAGVMAFLGGIGSLLGWKGIMVLTWLALMLLDYLTGTFAAMKEGQWSSARAREGIWHKCGTIVVILVAAIADGILQVICGNIPVLDITYPCVLLPMILAWYILTELGSILENAVKLGANPPKWLVTVLAVSAKAVERTGDMAFDKLTHPLADKATAEAARRVYDDDKDESGLLE